jgi:hypothetical protein
MATLKSPVGARDLGSPCSFILFIFSYLLLFIWSLPCPPFYFFLSFTPYLAPALRALLFFLIFYFLFSPCPARPFIFSYLLPLIWPLPCAPFYFSLSFTIYLAPALCICSLTKFQESISGEHRFSVTKLHASRSAEESSPTIR